MKKHVSEISKLRDSLGPRPHVKQPEGLVDCFGATVYLSDEPGVYGHQMKAISGGPGVPGRSEMMAITNPTKLVYWTK